ncbi:carbon catabolite repressor protein 4 homolog 6-like isoform X2 [Coffea arabica]|uniref:Carbon catabolite repressor protein 4 homolog 6-like isoform X2 n=1 Tax=Coffea arabica TaxID=13443 RepID=A0ABM4VBL2_COFAR
MKRTNFYSSSLMKRSCYSLHLLSSATAAAASTTAAVAATSTTCTVMLSRTSFRGGQGRGRGRRSYSDRPSVDGRDTAEQFVTGDSHFRQVQDSNRGFRPPYSRGNSNSNFQSSTRFSPRPNYYNPRPQQQQQQSVGQFHRPSPAPQQQPPVDQNQQAYRPPQPHYNFNQQFRPWQPRPRPPKDLEYRNWEHAKPGPPPEWERFTVLSYNILADYLATDHQHKLYFHVPRHMLDWKWRKRSILFELRLWSADILCFQEVDRFQDLKEELELRGYNGVWKMRTGDRVDGCAIFWRNSRFKLVHEESIEFSALGLRDNVAQICVFESLSQCNSTTAPAPSKSSKQAKKVVVCNIHVLFNPRRGEIKLGQIRVLLARAHAVSKLWDDASVIICGDFNSTPKSPLYNFVAEQKLDLSELPRDQVSGQTSAEFYPSRPSNPNSGALSTGNFSQVLPTASQMKAESCDSPLAEEKKNYPDECSGNEHFADCLSKPLSSVVEEPVESCINSIYVDERTDTKLRENDIEIFHGSDNEIKSTICDSYDLEESPVVIQDDMKSSVSPVKDVIQDINLLGDEMDNLLIDEFLEDTKEDGSFEEGTTTSSDIQETNPLGNESLIDTRAVDSEIVDVEQSQYDPSAWTPVELETATGSSDCLVMEHPLKLRSVYGEVEDSSGTRDSTGEPAVTSYHRRFLGTVDYIWRSEGLQTSRVLAPIPKHAMQWTRGFPTKKWGSDHIALVSELAFREDISSVNSDVKLQDHVQHLTLNQT